MIRTTHGFPTTTFRHVLATVVHSLPASSSAFFPVASHTWMMRNSTGIVPASVAPDGVTPNFEAPEDVYYIGNLVNLAVCTGVINLVFLVHVYVKLVVRKARLLPEDGFCVAAWLSVNGFYAMNFGMSHFGEGRNIWELSLDDYKALLKFMYISTTLYTPAAFCTKATLLLLIARVFSVHPVISRLIHVFIIIILLAYLPIGYLKIFICKPITAYWDNFETTDAGAVTGGNSSCRGQATLFMGDISISIVTDVLILMIPVIMAWRMEATWRQKLKITILLGAGGAATVTTVVRAYLNVQFMHTTNASKDFALSSITSVLELGIGLLCACLPSANLLCERWMASRGWVSQYRHSEKASSPDSMGRTASHCWSSLKSKLVPSTIRTTTYRAENETRTSRRRSSMSEMELDAHVDVVIFNNRLDVPSIGSRTDDRSLSSRCGDHRGLKNQDFEAQLDEIDYRKKESEDSWRGKDSVMAIDSG